MPPFRKVLLLGQSAHRSILEAFLGSYPDLQVMSLEQPDSAAEPWDAIVIADSQSGSQAADLSARHPGTPILRLDWEGNSFAWTVSRSGIPLEIDALLAVIRGDPWKGPAGL